MKIGIKRQQIFTMLVYFGVKFSSGADIIHPNGPRLSKKYFYIASFASIVTGIVGDWTKLKVFY